MADMAVICLMTQRDNIQGLEELLLVEFERFGTAPGFARQAACDRFGADYPGLAAVQLVLSELVGNAVKHADPGRDRRWVRVRIARDSARLYIEGSDPGALW